LLVGCPARTPVAKTTARAELDDPLATVRDTLRRDRDRDLETCKSAIAQLNNYLGRAQRKPAALSESERELLTKEAHLSPEELKEVAADEFTELDAAFLDERFLMLDALRSLSLDWSDEGRARLAFAWVMRQAWVEDSPLRAPPNVVPPNAVLRRGWGTEAQRAGTVLSIFEAAGLDGCQLAYKPEGGAPRFWAVGVLIGNDILLFDPKAGRPITGAGGKSIATLKQVRTNPELLKPFLADIKPPLDAKLIAEQSKVYISPPLSALAPRMRLLQDELKYTPLLQDELKYTPPLVLSVNAPELLARFKKAGEPAEFSNPPLTGRPEELGTPVRALAYFMPSAAGLGGLDRTRRMIAAYRDSLVPYDRLPPVLWELASRADVIEVAGKLRSHFETRFIDFFTSRGRARDLVLRGQLDEAIRELVDQQTQITKILDQIASAGDVDAAVAQWAKDLKAATSELSRMRREVQRKELSAEDPALFEAQSRLATLEKQATKATMMVESAAGEPMMIVTTYQLALCKHEQAERQSRRVNDPAVVRDAWQSAAGWWSTFLSKYAAKPGVSQAQVAHVKRLLEIATNNAASN
jgi:hypothetical protein